MIDGEPRCMRNDALRNVCVNSQAAAGSGGRLMAAFTLTLDVSHGNAASFPIIYTMGPVANNVLLPHHVRPFAYNGSLDCFYDQGLQRPPARLTLQL